MARRNGRNTMNNLKNLAGNDVSIFLFRYQIIGNGINFVLNKEIAVDMYPDVDEKLKPLAHACCETLVRYKHLRACLKRSSSSQPTQHQASHSKVNHGFTTGGQPFIILAQ